MYRAKAEDGIAFVTGASSGIGYATALELARRGYRVAAMARRARPLADLAAQAPGKIFATPGDVTDEAAMAATIETIERDHGSIALAFLNAGVSLQADRATFDATVVAETYAVNVTGTANCLAPLIKTMLARRKGQIAINASLAGYNGLPASFGYGSSKAALINMTESLRLAYQDQGLTFQLVSPGFVRTPMIESEEDYDTPGVIEADEAARIVCNGFERAGFEIAFPWQLAILSKIVRILPYRLRLPAIASLVEHAKRKQ
jgi:NAD(P)-dependent dehydrogenase (short-subunit alcohol dehydrogenase family)